MNRLLLCCVIMTAALASAAHPKHKYFDEYLLQQSMLVQQINVVAAAPAPMLLRTGKMRSKDDQCCSLGQMAGVRGFHCFSQFYAARLLYRNYNRAQNKRISALLRGGKDQGTDKLMRTFGQCIEHRGAIFHKCCRHASLRDQ